MSISYGSMLPDGERLITVVVDRHEKAVMEGVLYLGCQPTGRNFSGYVALPRMMEEYFEHIQYPRPVMNLRGLQLNKDNEAVRKEEWVLRRCGSISSYVIRVTQRQNASWQGIVGREDGAACRFSSFLDLVVCLEKDLDRLSAGKSDKDEAKVNQRFGTRPEQGIGQTPEKEYKGEDGRREEGQERKAALDLEKKRKQEQVERYLEIVMGFPKTEKIMPDTIQYHFQMEDRSRTFVVRFLFYENCTCQGTLYWQEGHREESFRSFLELVLMMSGAIGDETYFPCD